MGVAQDCAIALIFPKYVRRSYPVGNLPMFSSNRILRKTMEERSPLMLSCNYIQYVYTVSGSLNMSISRKRLEELQNIPESAIDTSDRPELDASFWEKAKLVKPLTKQAISLRVDRDVLDWFKSQGKGYQSLMNAVLRSYVEHQINNNQ